MNYSRLQCGRWMACAALATALAAMSGCGGGSGDSSNLVPASGQAGSNKAPSISGSPATSAIVGSPYSFMPTAGDGDGDALVFSVQNKPAWMTFNTTTGALTGTPNQAGSFSGITISVSDGKTSTVLPAFTLNVTAATGSVALSWAAPTQNTDDSPLSDLQGYRIYYGTSQNALTQTVDVASTGQSTESYVIGSLQPATYYFAVTARAATGLESDFSNVAMKTVQ